MPIINTYNLFLSSLNRTAGTSDNFRLQLFRPISLKSPNNWFTCRVGSVEIPYVFKLLNSSNNVIDFQFNRGGTTTTSTITIAPGNYNIIQLLDEIKLELIAKIQALRSYTAPLEFTYDRSTGHAIFSIVGTDSDATSITIINNSPVFMKCIGMIHTFTFSYVSPSVRTNAESVQNVNVFQNPAIYVRSESLIQTQNIEALVGNQSELSDILAKIQVNVIPQTMIQWINPTDLKLEITNKIIDEINLYLGSSTSYSLDLGNLDWAIRLTLEEHTDDIGDKDIAVNMSRGVDPYLQELMSEREAIVSKLDQLKQKLIPNKKDAKERRKDKADKSEGKERDSKGSS
jgi:hypothetical protein